MQRYFEDVQVGDRFGSQTYVVTEKAMIEFARDFDPQPFHLDRAAADASDFGALVASGWFTAAVGMRLWVTGELQFVGGAIGLGVEELRWPAAVRVGDTLRLETEILQLRRSCSKPGRGIVRFRNAVTNQDDKTVMTLIANALVRCNADG
ncbi:MAG: MaoC family dehydratase [Chthoniobacterales bacterium]